MFWEWVESALQELTPWTPPPPLYIIHTPPPPWTCPPPTCIQMGCVSAACPHNNYRCSPSAVLMLAQRRRWMASIDTAVWSNGEMFNAEATSWTLANITTKMVPNDVVMLYRLIT